MKYCAPMNYGLKDSVQSRQILEQMSNQSHYIEVIIRDLPRLFDQVGHQTTNSSIENKHFFTR